MLKQIITFVFKEFNSNPSLHDKLQWSSACNPLIFNPAATKQVLNKRAPPDFKFPAQHINEFYWRVDGHAN